MFFTLKQPDSGGKLIRLSFALIFLLVSIPHAQDFQGLSNDTVQQRFAPPPGFTRVQVQKGSWADWLRHLPLLPPGSAVKDYRGRIRVKVDDSTLAAVTAIRISKRNLDQCMDILMRLRSIYLQQTGRQKVISFPLPDGLLLSWQDWQSGQRPVFKGLHFRLIQSAGIDSSAANFEHYLRTLFNYSGTQTFYHYYPKMDPSTLRIGDFIVKKGRKGHAVMIVDLAQNKAGQRVALFGQGDTPACAFYILNYRKGQPWVPIDFSKKVIPLPIKKKMSWDGLRRFGD